jgi:hypothetical protein
LRSKAFDLLKTYACVVPCIVATVYKAASHCCYYDSEQRIEGTERHRELLVEAFEKATRRLLISSPFLTQSAIEADEVTSLIRAARKKNVAVDVYTGLNASRDRDGALLEAAIALLVNAGARVWRTSRVHAS